MKTGFIMALAMIGVLLAAGACSSTQGTSGLENTVWKLESYGEEGSLRRVLDGTEITATFDGDKDQVHGSAGANTYSGRYEIGGNMLSILELVWTEMYRLDPPGVMEQEEQYLKAFKAAESFEIQDGELKITSGKQLLLYTELDSGVLQGLVTIGPITPVEKPGEEPTVPPEVYEARKVMVYNENGSKLVDVVDLGGEGSYGVELRPGIYTIDINHLGVDRSSDVPKKVEIRRGETVELNIDIDTGIR
jgi:heat shock protein HslJ